MAGEKAAFQLGGGHLVQRGGEAGVVQAADAAGIDQAGGAEGRVLVPARVVRRLVEEREDRRLVPVVEVGVEVARVQQPAAAGQRGRHRKAGAGEVDAAVRPRHRLQGRADVLLLGGVARSEEHTSELQSLMRISYAVFCLKKQTTKTI